ncbi:hypothetical protein B0H13DRAFT_1862996 [Mycena leptocephala]|nr:hypothetical protein B0H13DRAFT_1862996 [Mycena leptocephala]
MYNFLALLDTGGGRDRHDHCMCLYSMLLRQRTLKHAAAMAVLTIVPASRVWCFGSTSGSSFGGPYTYILAFFPYKGYSPITRMSVLDMDQIAALLPIAITGNNSNCTSHSELQWSAPLLAVIGKVLLREPVVEVRLDDSTFSSPSNFRPDPFLSCTFKDPLLPPRNQPFHFDPQEPPKAGKQEIKGTKSKKVKGRQAIREREEDVGAVERERVEDPGHGVEHVVAEGGGECGEEEVAGEVVDQVSALARPASSATPSIIRASNARQSRRALRAKCTKRTRASAPPRARGASSARVRPLISVAPPARSRRAPNHIQHTLRTYTSDAQAHPRAVWSPSTSRVIASPRPAQNVRRPRPRPRHGNDKLK